VKARASPAFACSTRALQGGRVQLGNTISWEQFRLSPVRPRGSPSSSTCRHGLTDSSGPLQSAHRSELSATIEVARSLAASASTGDVRVALGDELFDGPREDGPSGMISGKRPDSPFH
jgi:hypothetical protein